MWGTWLGLALPFPFRSRSPINSTSPALLRPHLRLRLLQRLLLRLRPSFPPLLYSPLARSLLVSPAPPPPPPPRSAPRPLLLGARCPDPAGVPAPTAGEELRAAGSP
ncbi:hypothetical protein PVAP13_1KG208326 [Panicum virgatum]|uniref:Uncharacterized protein n=1 Tax=Panicum virgatum TaxID=38727 RepID=A0A8T0XWQ3_PANVG|nr:hypothetical protein PVAP13_1KG208326 [Panicum virgatum]